MQTKANKACNLLKLNLLTCLFNLAVIILFKLDLPFGRNTNLVNYILNNIYKYTNTGIVLETI